MSVKLLLLLAVGCGRINFSDTAADAPIGTDAPLGSGPFGPAMVLPTNSLVADDDPALSGDALELVFDSERDGLGDLYVTKRADRGSSWSMPIAITDLATSAYDEDGPMLSADALMLTFASNRPPETADPNQLWSTTRTSRSSAWDPPLLLTELGSANVEEHMPMTADKLYALFCSQRDGTRRVYVTRRTTVTSPWDPPELVPELDDGYPISAIAMDPTGTYLVFSANRPGGPGGLDLFFATRDSLSEPWSPPTAFDELNTALEDIDPTISADRRVLAFVRGSANNATDRDVFITER